MADTDIQLFQHWAIWTCLLCFLLALLCLILRPKLSSHFIFLGIIFNGSFRLLEAYTVDFSKLIGLFLMFIIMLHSLNSNKIYYKDLDVILGHCIITIYSILISMLTGASTVSIITQNLVFILPFVIYLWVKNSNFCMAELAIDLKVSLTFIAMLSVILLFTYFFDKQLYEHSRYLQADHGKHLNMQELRLAPFVSEARYLGVLIPILALLVVYKKNLKFQILTFVLACIIALAITQSLTVIILLFTYYFVMLIKVRSISALFLTSLMLLGFALLYTQLTFIHDRVAIYSQLVFNSEAGSARLSTIAYILYLQDYFGFFYLGNGLGQSAIKTMIYINENSGFANGYTSSRVTLIDLLADLGGYMTLFYAYLIYKIINKTTSQYQYLLYILGIFTFFVPIFPLFYFIAGVMSNENRS